MSSVYDATSNSERALELDLDRVRMRWMDSQQGDKRDMPLCSEIGMESPIVHE